MGEKVYNYYVRAERIHSNRCYEGLRLQFAARRNQLSRSTDLREHDEATPEATAFYREKFPNAIMRVFEESSHEHHLEKAARIYPAS